MNILLFCALGYVLLFILFLSCSTLGQLDVTQKNISIFLILLTLSMAYIGFCIKPSNISSDINRHFLSYDYIAGVYGDAAKIIKIRENTISGLFLWLGILFVSVFLGSRHFVPFFSVLLTYLFLSLSIKEICKNFKFKAVYLAFFFLVKIGLVSWFHMYAGLRNTCAFSAIAYAIILLSTKTKSNKGKIVVSLLVAVMMHTASWFIVFLFLAMKFLKKSKFFNIFICLWSLFSMVVVKVLSYFPNPTIEYIMKKILRYYGFGADKAIDIRIFMVYILFITVFSLSYYFISKSGLSFSSFEKIYLENVHYILLFLLGSVLIPTILVRSMYLIGYIFLPFIIISRKYLKSSYYYINSSIEILLSVIMVMYNVVGLKSHMYL